MRSLNLHEHEVGGGVEVGQADEGEVVVEAVEGGWHEVEAKHLFFNIFNKVDNRDFVVQAVQYRHDWGQQHQSPWP